MLTQSARSADTIARVNESVKRVEDVVLGTVIMSVIAVPMLAIAAGIKATSPGPVLFKQKRHGKNGQVIEVLKFRSMRADATGVKQAVQRDPRITKFGSFLRRTSLDELPQFINVLRGEMSIVGPRPHAVEHDNHYGRIIKDYTTRQTVKPGITGWAQVNGWRGETDTLDKMQKRIEHDIEYIKSWSFFFDLKIILMTFGPKAHQNAK